MKKQMQNKKMVLDLLLGRLKPYSGFSLLKHRYPVTSCNFVLNEILKIKNKATDYLLQGLLPRNYNELLTGNILQYKENCLEQELLWNTIFFKRNAKIINDFLERKNCFEINFINGNYDAAQDVLTHIEQNVCYSLWTLENKFLLEEYKNGLESNKELLDQINKIPSNVPILWFADIFSYKAEKTITESQYRYRMNKIINRVSEQSKPYMAFKIYGFDTFSSKELGDILFFENLSSIIDRYLTFIMVCQVLCSSKDVNQHYIDLVGKCLAIMGNSISDPNILNLRLYLNVECFEEPSKEDHLICEVGHNYTLGNYELVLTSCEKLFDVSSNCLELYEFYVKAMLYVNHVPIKKEKSNIRDIIISNMFDSYIKQESAIDASNNLLMYVRIFNNMGFGINLYKYFANRYISDNYRFFTVISELNTKHRNARYCLAYSNARHSLEYLDRYKNIFGEKAHVKLFISYFSYQNKLTTDITLKEIPLLRRKWFEITKLINEEQYDDALDKLRDLQESYLNEPNIAIKFYKTEKIVTEQFKVLIKKKDLILSLNLFIDNYLDNTNMVIRFNHNDLYTLIKINSTKKLKENISLPILTHICRRTQNELYTACANYLDAHKLKKPSDLIKEHIEHDSRKLTYFFRYVCTYDVMDSMYQVFNTEEKVDNERIIICQYLREINSNNDEIYVNEISQITQKQSLKKRIQILDEGKIDIDLNNIRNNKKEIFSENYKRYIDFGNFDFTYDIMDISNSKVLYINYHDAKDHTGLTEKKNQKYLLFKEMFYDYRDEFAFGQYGLDSSLSTRIRHGRLQNHIRNVFEQSNLVYSKDSINSTTYVPNEQLEQDLTTCGFDIHIIESVNKIFGTFSKKIDDSIEKINSSYIRIRTENINPEGMFNFQFGENELSVIFFKANTMPNEQTLFDYFEEIMMNRVEQGLKTIQSLFNSLKEDYIKYINELEGNISIQFNNNDQNYIYLNIKQNIASCRTMIQRETAQVSNWFKFPKKQEHNDFDIKQLLETCIAVNKRLYTSFDEIKLTTENMTETLFTGNTISYFIDILVILFSNAIIHSGFAYDLKQLNIKLNIKEDEKHVYFTMQNNLSSDVDKNELSKKIKIAEKRLQDSDNQRYYSYEGGSGYVKIKKILDYNLRVKWGRLSFWYREQTDDYEVEITLEKRGIIPGGIISADINN